MFLWITLPEGMSAMALFEAAAKQNVIFVPKPADYRGGGSFLFMVVICHSNCTQMALSVEDRYNQVFPDEMNGKTHLCASLPFADQNGFHTFGIGDQTSPSYLFYLK